MPRVILCMGLMLLVSELAFETQRLPENKQTNKDE